MRQSTAQTYICTLQKPFTASLKNEYQYIKIWCKSIINNKNINQQNMFVTLIDIRLVTSWCLLVRPIIKSSNFRWQLPGRKKMEENWSERLLLKVYIIVCYFSLIIFSTVELTSFATRKLCSLLSIADKASWSRTHLVLAAHDAWWRDEKGICPCIWARQPSYRLHHCHQIFLKCRKAHKSRFAKQIQARHATQQFSFLYQTPIEQAFGYS